MSKKVLIVEDSPTQAANTKFVLEGKGYEVSVANDGPSGIRGVGDFRPDLIVLDAFLPGMNGFDVCKELKNKIEFRSIPIIMFSNENKLKNMVTAYETGADYYVVKGNEGEKVLCLLIETVFARMSRRPVRTS